MVFRVYRRSPTVLVRFAWVLLSAGCYSERSAHPLPVLQDSAGVAIWSLGSDATDAGLTVEKVGRLALPDSGWVAQADGVAADEGGGRIYVLDELGPRLLAFDLQGDLIGEVGRFGEGPGEFEMPVAVDVDPDGTVWVVDGSRSLLLSWDRQGQYVGQKRLLDPYWGPGFEMSGGDFLYVRGDEDADGEGLTERLIRSGAGTASELLSLAQRWVPVNSACGTLSLPELMTPSIIWNAGAGHVVATSWPDYAIQVFERDSLIASLRRAVPPVRATQSDAEEVVSTGAHRFLIESCGMSPTEVLRATGSVEAVSPIDKVMVDPLGRIWVSVSSGANGLNYVDILDVRTGYVGSLQIPAFPVEFVSPDLFLAISEQEWGAAVEIWEVKGA